MKNNFEYQINKLIKHINSLGYHAHKNHAQRLHNGKYIDGEYFDYEILLPGYTACFDAKETINQIWNFCKKDIKQGENLKHCKNAGADAFFVVYFITLKKMIKFDVDVFIHSLKQNKKHLKPEDGEEWDIKELLERLDKRRVEGLAVHVEELPF